MISLDIEKECCSVTDSAEKWVKFLGVTQGLAYMFSIKEKHNGKVCLGHPH